MKTHTQLTHWLQQYISAITLGTMLCLLAIPSQLNALEYNISTAIAGIPADITVEDLPAGTNTILVLPPYGEEIAFDVSGKQTATVRLSAEQTEQAGDYHVSILNNNQILAKTATLYVKPGSISINQSSVSVNKNYLEPNGNDQVIITITGRDQYGNILAKRPFKLVSNRNEDTIIEQTRETDEAGEQVFILKTATNGSITLRAIDLITGDALLQTMQITAGSINNYAQGGPTTSTNLYPSKQYNTTTVSSNQYAPTYSSPLVGNILNGRSLYGQAAGFDIVDHFEFEVPTSLNANVEENLVIIAKDRNNQTVEDYEGSVELSSTDPDAILPSFGVVKFNGSDLGRKRLVLGLRFSTPGNHLLYAEDSNNPSVNGQIELYVAGRTVAPSVTQRIAILSPRQNVVTREQTVTLQGSGPPFINLVVTGGVQDTLGETDIDGRFSITVPLDTQKNEHTLRITNDNGSADSGEFTVFTDANPPKITKFVFDPVSPKAGEDVLITVNVSEKESSLQSVNLSVNDQSVPMEATENDTYEYVFTPDADGLYTFTVNATDGAGNTSLLQGMLEVQKKPVPTVQNLRGSIEENLALLQWDSLDGEGIDKYRIYIGESPEEFLYTLETTIPEAKVNGLQSGGVYYFAITAIQGNRESAEKSDILKIASPKTTISVTPGDTQLLVEWISPLDPDQISTFQLRYGITADNLTEQRILNGKLRRHIMDDLINGQTYYIEITPITITGQLVTTASSITQGTPSGSGLHTGAPDPIPSDLLGGLIGKNPTGKPPSGVPPAVIKDIPNQPATGINSTVLLLLCFGSIFGCIWWYTKRKYLLREHAFFAAMQKQYTNSSY